MLMFSVSLDAMSFYLSCDRPVFTLPQPNRCNATKNPMAV